jgi:ribosomal protein S18 acetylase RimI-like enzyme
MNYRIIPITQLSQQQIVELARLHQRVMRSLLSDLDLPVVEKYYQIACKDSKVIGFSALSESEHVLGWAIGSPEPNHLNRRLRAAWPWFISQMLRVLLTRPRVLGQLLASIQTASAPLSTGAIELTYLGVDPSARGQGLGREVLHAFLQAAREAQYHSAVLSVEAENKEAIALYTRAGFTVIDSFTEGSFHRHRMELIF